MTVHSPAMGRAVFGTHRGLFAEGNGVLSNAPIQIFEFKKQGRERDGVLHHVGVDSFPFFFRRIHDSSSGHEMNLVGLVAPCRDAANRPGFLGCAVSVPIDMDSTKGSAFTDWTTITSEFSELGEAVISMRDDSTMQVHWSRVIEPTASDRHVRWEPTEGETVYIHLEGEMSMAETLRHLQSLAFKFGTGYTTIIVLREPIEGSFPISSKEVTGAVSALDAARDEADRMGQRAAAEAQAVKSKTALTRQPFESVQHGRPVEEECACAQVIEALEEQVEDLRGRVENLERQISGRSSQRSQPHSSRLKQPSQRYQPTQLMPHRAFGGEERESDNRWIILMGAAVVMVVLFLGLMAWLLYGSLRSAEQAPPLADPVAAPTADQSPVARDDPASSEMNEVD